MLVLFQGHESPSEAEWADCLKLLAEILADSSRAKPKVLVITDGGGPTPEQRKLLGKMLEGKPIPVAVVSESMKARFVSAAIALINRNNRSFSGSELPEAYAYLGLTASEKRAAEMAVAEMKRLSSTER